jgi:hypothetical protein
VATYGEGRSVCGIDWTNGIFGGLRGHETLNRPIPARLAGTVDQNWAKTLPREAVWSMGMVSQPLTIAALLLGHCAHWGRRLCKADGLSDFAGK